MEELDPNNTFDPTSAPGMDPTFEEEATQSIPVVPIVQPVILPITSRDITQSVPSRRIEG